MADPTSISHAEVTTLVAGAAGSAVSLKFISGPWYERVLMAIGGCAAARFLTVPMTNLLSVPHTETDEYAVSFLIGLFAMALVHKTFAVIQAFDSASLAKVMEGWFKRPGA